MVHKKALRAVWPQNPDHYVDATQLSRAVSSSYRNQMSLAALGAVALEERRKPGRKQLLWLGFGWPVEEEGSENSFDWITELSTRLREARIELSDRKSTRLNSSH